MTSSRAAVAQLSDILHISLPNRRTRYCTPCQASRRPFSTPITSRKSLPKRFYAQKTDAQLSPALKDDLSSLDRLLSSGAEDDAVAMAISLRDRGILRAFGTASQIPKRVYTLEELRLNKIETQNFLAPGDTTLNGVRNMLQAAFVAGLGAAYATHAADFVQLVQWVIIVAGILTADQVANAGGLEALAVDSAGRILNSSYARRVALHEAGHFLIAYLLGLLPKSYTLSSWDAFKSQRALNVQAGTTFCDAAFQREVATGRLSSGSLDVYSCVALAGVATEWLRFGRAEGGLADVQQLDRLMSALQFTQAKADGQVRWAVLNVVTLLRRHSAVQEALADAMQRGVSVGECIGIVEAALAGSDDI